jgi:hypothetical protein
MGSLGSPQASAAGPGVAPEGLAVETPGTVDVWITTGRVMRAGGSVLGAFGSSMTFITASLTFAFFRRIMSSVLRSKSLPSLQMRVMTNRLRDRLLP